MTEPRWTRFLPLAGIAAVVLWLTGFMIMESVRPEGTPTAEQILAHFQENADVGIAAYAYMLGSVFFLVFVAALWSRLRSATAATSPLVALVLIAGIFVGLGQLFTYGSDLEAHLDADTISASTAEAYYYFGDFWFVGGMLTAALMIVATGLVALQSRVLPGWLALASLVMAVPLLLPPVGWIVMLTAFPLWIIATGVILTMRAPQPITESDKVAV